MSRRLNPGRSSTYQTEEAVQTSGASSVPPNGRPLSILQKTLIDLCFGVATQEHSNLAIVKTAL
jgi:hypothetical protein